MSTLMYDVEVTTPLGEKIAEFRASEEQIEMRVNLAAKRSGWMRYVLFVKREKVRMA